MGVLGGKGVGYGAGGGARCWGRGTVLGVGHDARGGARFRASSVVGLSASLVLLCLHLV